MKSVQRPGAEPGPAAGPAETSAPATTGTHPQSLDATQLALAAEHAAVWVYGLVSAFLPASLAADVSQGAKAHRARRDDVEALIRSAGQVPVTAAPAYLTPRPVTDAASAVTVAVAAESDVAGAWRALLERTDQPPLRRLALAGLVDATVRGAQWRRSAGTTPLVPIFPGQS